VQAVRIILPKNELLVLNTRCLENEAWHFTAPLLISYHKMKILEAQSATLTNYEVYTHLQAQRARYAKKEMQGRRPGNLETVVKEVGLL